MANGGHFIVDSVLRANETTTLGGLLQTTIPGSWRGQNTYGGVATIPLEFRGTGNTCGVLLLWLRR